MSGMSHPMENAVLLMALKGTDPAWRGNTKIYLALFDDNALTPTELEAGSRAHELTYTGYARVELTKASAWTDAGDDFYNAVAIQFGKRTDVGSQVARYFAVVDTASGDFTECIWGQLNADLTITQNVQPQFAINDLVVAGQ